MNPRSWIAIGFAGAVVVGVVAVVVGLWQQVGDSDISAAGWGAMVLGIVLTLVVGVGLMALVFISNRRGYDDEAGR
jgi:cation transporter-like permease